MNEIIKEKKHSFHYKGIQYKVIKKEQSMMLIEVEEKEFRKESIKESMLYYSRIIRYRMLGYILENNQHAMLEYIVCTGCFIPIDNYMKCNNCNMSFNKPNPFFLNCNLFLSSKHYNSKKNKFNLGIIDEIYRDQRQNMSNPLKQEIYAAALHPDKIVRILQLTNDLEHLDNYI